MNGYIKMGGEMLQVSEPCRKYVTALCFLARLL